jgi:hypothetical protein
MWCTYKLFRSEGVEKCKKKKYPAWLGQATGLQTARRGHQWSILTQRCQYRQARFSRSERTCKVWPKIQAGHEVRRHQSGLMSWAETNSKLYSVQNWKGTNFGQKTRDRPVLQSRQVPTPEPYYKPRPPHNHGIPNEQPGKALALATYSQSARSIDTGREDGGRR